MRTVAWHSIKPLPQPERRDLSVCLSAGESRHRGPPPALVARWWPKLVLPSPVQWTVLTLTLGLAYLHCVLWWLQVSPGSGQSVIIVLSVRPAKLTQITELTV